MSHDPVDNRLAELRRALEDTRPPAALEEALVARFRATHQRHRPALWWMPPLALAATLALVSWMIRGVQEPVRLEAGAAPVPAEDLPFLALKPLERIALEPGATVVASEFPRALLADWGLPVAPERAAEPVRAETLYSADGEALAIRIVN